MLDQLWCNLAVSQCIEQGIDHFFLAPGSRCTPLTIAVANHGNAVITQHFDERGLAFAALGYARATRKPGVFICTSGTAVANALPAVVEAAMDSVPMLLFTSDRPPELRGTGANQTIDQQHIFGKHAKWFFDMPCATNEIGLSFVQSQVRRAITESAGGPVHVNWMFREPFGVNAPDNAIAVARQAYQSVGESVDSKKASLIPVTSIGDTLVICGGSSSEDASVAKRLADELNAPMLTDITAGTRELAPDNVTNHKLPRPQTIIHVGGRVVSKAWLNYTKMLEHEARFLHLSSQDVTINPNHLRQERIVAPLAQTDFQVTPHERTTDSFRAAWEHSDASRRNAIAKMMDSAEDRLSEPRIAYTLGQQIQDGDGLFIGNSTPIRDMDWFSFWEQNKNVTVSANRGASGIDGLIASAVGFATGLKHSTTLLLGDLSALHDLNSLAMIAKSSVPLTVLIVNNGGGGIFDMLPISTQTDHFEKFFATPHDIGFEQAAKMFRLEYCSLDSTQEFRRQYTEARDSGRSSVIELKTDREYNKQIRKRIQAEISK